jgi:hypothetical protein
MDIRELFYRREELKKEMREIEGNIRGWIMENPSEALAQGILKIDYTGGGRYRIKDQNDRV